MTNNPVEDFMNSEEYDDYRKKMLQKEKYLKKGPNVIHLQYLSSTLSEVEIGELENQVKKVGFEFSRIDRSDEIVAFLDDYELISFIAITQTLAYELLKNIGPNATWDLIKLLLSSVLKKVRNKFYYRTTSQNSTKKEISFGLKVDLDKNTSFNFKLDGNLDESTLTNSLDKILEFLKSQRVNENYQHSDLVYFDGTAEKWKKIDVKQELRKQSKRKKNKK